jgi:hypothetical protein
MNRNARDVYRAGSKRAGGFFKKKKVQARSVPSRSKCHFGIWNWLSGSRDPFGYRGMGTQILRIARIKTDFMWPCGHFFDFLWIKSVFGGA